MNTHEHQSQPLAAIEDHASKAGVPIENLDAHIAEALDVPEEYLHAYRLVARAIDRHLHPDLQKQLPDAPRGVAEALVTSQRLLETLGWGVATVYRETYGEGHSEVHAMAAQTLGTCLQLRTTLREAADRIEPNGLGPERTPDQGLGVDLDD